MDKQDIVARMVYTIEKLNEHNMKASGLDDAAIADMSSKMRIQLFSMNQEVLDDLLEEGLISIVEKE